MIIQRRSGKVSNLFFISPRLDLDRQIIQPSIPITELTKKGLENSKVRRISLFRTVGQGITALEHVSEGDIVAVYIARNIQRGDIIEPSITDSPKSLLTNEQWILSSVTLEKVGDIRVGPVERKEMIPLGPRGTRKRVEIHSWTDLRPEWQQKKLPIYEQKEFGLRSFISRQFRNSAARDLKIARRGRDYINSNSPYNIIPNEIQLKKDIIKESKDKYRTIIKSSPFVKRTGNFDLTDSSNINIPGIDNYIQHHPIDGLTGLSHELGHSVNRSIPKFRAKEAKMMKGIKLEPEDGMITKLRNINLKRKYANLVNDVERSATKNGLDILRSKGVQEKDLELSKKYLKEAGNTYRDNNAEWKRDLGNLIKKRR